MSALTALSACVVPAPLSARVLVKDVLAQLGVPKDDSRNLTFHLEGEKCRDARPIEQLNRDNGGLQYAEDYILFHRPAKCAFTRRVEDKREEKTADVQATIHIQADEEDIDTIRDITVPAMAQPGALRHFIQKLLTTWAEETKTHQPLVRALIKDRKKPLWYSTALRTPLFGDDQWVNADATQYQLNIDTLSDMFNDPLSSNNKIEILAALVMKQYIDKDFRRKPKGTSSVVEPVLITIPYDFERVGTSKRTATPSTVAGGISYIEPLVAYRFQDSSGEFKYGSGPAYEFGDFCIGDCNDNTTYLDMDAAALNAFKFLPPYDKDSSWKKLQAPLKEEFQKRPSVTPVGSSVPIMPPYSFNNLTPLPKQIKIAVYCADNITERGMTLPKDIRFSIDVNTAMPADAIRNAINKHLSKTSSEGTFSLFQKPVKDTWSSELWVLPQEPSEMKLYRFAEVDDPYGCVSLFRLLDANTVKRHGPQLFVMAHLITHGDEALVTGTIFDPAKQEQVAQEESSQEESGYDDPPHFKQVDGLAYVEADEEERDRILRRPTATADRPKLLPSKRLLLGPDQLEKGALSLFLTSMETSSTTQAEVSLVVGLPIGQVEMASRSEQDTFMTMSQALNLAMLGRRQIAKRLTIRTTSRSDDVMDMKAAEDMTFSHPDLTMSVQIHTYHQRAPS
ncbi:hypothetical protein LTR78_008527 [Recurvomyces mirabilis]|uniref:Uncharacterized protein n=1 Tax=Recurvomyces mirabilis TaxID=574656 RepID=A0AAE0TQ09_9PEZI|nr:hypothetical protein LTR78_008527 [Recurvomyces mirabilis]KAK5156278.1 hypothetical protein LTS14_005166 [Recurvomyces mirabilis]